MRQLPLELGHRPALGREDFLIAPCNQEAVAWIDRWPDWPGSGKLGGLVLCGPGGCGKTHLAQVWRQASGAISLDGADLSTGDADELLGNAQHACVEDFLPAVVPKGTAETTLFHIHNLLAERGGTLLVTGAAPPARSSLNLADLSSRLNVFAIASIDAPDDALIAAVLVKQFQDRQLTVGEGVIAYLVARMERSFAAASILVDALDRAALANRRQITVALAREVLESID
jgi:chromosomal replication initiation ATPase DnaA